VIQAPDGPPSVEPVPIRLRENMMVRPHELVRLVIAETDRNIAAAYANPTQARAGWARRPTAGRGHACTTAEACLDELVDLHVALGRSAGDSAIEAPA
jgi:hypothetical protein